MQLTGTPDLYAFVMNVGADLTAHRAGMTLTDARQLANTMRALADELDAARESEM